MDEEYEEENEEYNYYSKIKRSNLEIRSRSVFYFDFHILTQVNKSE